MEDTPGAKDRDDGAGKRSMARLAGGEAKVDCGYLEDMLRILGHPGPTGGGCMVLFLRQGRVCSSD